LLLFSLHIHATDQVVCFLSFLPIFNDLVGHKSFGIANNSV
jgi:hypothetical protein